jgi:hypothetical protein
MDRSLEGVISSHRRLKELMEDEIEAQKRLNELVQIGKANERRAEDARTRLDRAERIAAETDPNKRRLLREQFAAEDEETAQRRNAEDAGTLAGEFEKTSYKYEGRARVLRDQAARLDEQIRDQEDRIERKRPVVTRRIASEDRHWFELGGLLTPKSIERSRESIASGRAADDPELKKEYDRLKAMKEERERLVKEAEKFDREADYFSKRAELEKPGASSQVSGVSGQGSVAGVEAETGWQDTKRAQDKAQADFERERNKRNADRQWASDYSKADDGRKQVLLMQREAAAKAALQEAEKALAEELQKDVKARSEERIAEARRGITEADNALFDVSHRRDELEKKDQQWWDRADEREAAVLQRGADALNMGTRTKYNAIGLGDGIDSVRSDARTMIEKLSELVRVTKENKPPMPQKVALFGE